MRAAPGAIERVHITDGTVHTYTIEDQKPVGICGSGILDAVAVMRTGGVMDNKGAFHPDFPGVFRGEKTHEFLLVPASETGHGKDITVSRKDVSEIQLAKAAIRTGLDVLMQESGVEPVDLDKVIIAGAFGTYIDVPNAITIGMFPDIPLERFQQVGNAAGMGARLALLSLQQRQLANDIGRDVDYIELTTHKDFQGLFVQSMYLNRL
jgi:uncharacterized 2Fe-2S/4Fe-4S cluster protein (DUF4445 family)